MLARGQSFARVFRDQFFRFFVDGTIAFYVMFVPGRRFFSGFVTLGEIRSSTCAFRRGIFTSLPTFASPQSTETGQHSAAAEAADTASEEEPLWKNPEKHALPRQETTYTDFKEVKVDWDYVKRLLPLNVIPEAPKNCGILPSGWRPPRDPAPDLPYYIRRQPNHLPALFLERRRDELNPKTMDFEYVELVTVRNISGDIFACEQDLRDFLEDALGHPVGTHVDELKGLIKVKGADRTWLEKFVFEKGF